MTRVVYGSETELVVARWVPGKEGAVLEPVERQILTMLIRIAAAAYGVRFTEFGRLQLVDGGILYIDGQSLEYATPPCRTWDDLALHEHDLDSLIGSIIEDYESITEQELVAIRPGSGPGGELCGYHENYGLRHDDYFQLFSPSNFIPSPVWLKVIVPFLVTRIIFTGGGGVRREGFTLSPRASATTHVFHHSTSPERPIVHLKRPQLNDEFLRVQITCGDANQMLHAIRTRIAFTSMVLLTAAQGGFDALDLSLTDPVAAIRKLSFDMNAELQLADGRVLRAPDVQRAIADRVMTAIPVLTDRDGGYDPSGLGDVFALWRKTS